MERLEGVYVVNMINDVVRERMRKATIKAVNKLQKIIAWFVSIFTGQK